MFITYLKSLRRRMRYNVFGLFDWCSTEYKLGEAGIEGEEADAVPGTCLESGVGRRGGGVFRAKQRGVCGVAPILTTWTQDMFGGIMRAVWAGV